MTLYEIETATSTTGSANMECVFIFPPLRVAPDLRALLWARELQLYLDWRRPRREENPCGCKPCVGRRDDEEDEYWDVLLCGGCDGMRQVATPCPRCDSATYHPENPTDARKGSPTGFGPYKGPD